MGVFPEKADQGRERFGRNDVIAGLFYDFDLNLPGTALFVWWVPPPSALTFPLFDAMTPIEDKVMKDLKESLETLLGEHLVRIALFGSRARGDYGNESDIDIAVLVRGLTRDLKDQILDKVAEIEFEYLLPLSVLVLSEDEFNHLKRRERRIALDIEAEGVSL